MVILKYKYKLRTDVLTDEEDRKFTVYGIVAETLEGIILESIPDIFYDKHQAEEFVKSCNSGEALLNYLKTIVQEELEKMYISYIY